MTTKNRMSYILKKNGDKMHKGKTKVGQQFNKIELNSIKDEK